MAKNRWINIFSPFTGLLILVQFFLTVLPSVEAQNPAFQVFDEKSGLPIYAIYSIKQNKRGNLILGTFGGIYEFDSEECYEVPAAEGITEKGAFGLVQTVDSNYLFYNGANEILFYDGDSIRRFFIQNLPPNLKINRFESIGAFCSEVYLYTNQGFFVLDLRLHSLKGPFRSPYKVRAGFRDTTGTVHLFYKADSIFSIYPDGRQRRSSTGVLPLRRGLKIVQRTEGEYWLAERDMGRMYSINLEKGKLGLTKFYDNPKLGTINEIVFDKEGEGWICTGNGLWKVFGQRFSKAILNGTQIFNLHQDREGNYWIVQFRNKIHLGHSLDHFVFSRENRSFSSDGIHIISQVSKDSVLAFAYGGHYYLISSDKVEEFRIPGIKKRGVLVENPKGGNGVLDVTGMLYPIEKDFDIGKPFVLKRGMEVILKWSKDQWLGLFGNGQVVSFKWQNDSVVIDSLFLKKPAHNFFVEDHSLNKWVIGEEGIYRFDPEGNSIGTYEKEEWPFISYIRGMTETQDGSLWFSVWGEGLVRLKDGVLTDTFGINEALKQYDLRLLKNDGTHLWLGSGEGMFKINPENWKCELFDYRDGLGSNDITSFKILEDELWANTSKGLVVMPLPTLKNNHVPPQISIKGVSIWGKDTSLHKQYELNHKQSNLRISFLGRAFRSMGDFQYEYRMLGLDDNWIRIPSSTNFVRFPQLQSGTYTFEVRALNEDGIKSTDPARLSFHISPPWWKSWWFVMLLIASSFLVILGIFTLYVQRLHHKNKLENQLILSELTALKSRMNPHFLFNALNSIQAYIAREDSRQAHKYLSKFAHLIRMILEMSGKPSVPLAQELEALELYLSLEQTRFEDDFDFVVRLEEELDPEYIFIPSMLIQPYVENAIIHGLRHKEGDKKLLIELSQGIPHTLLCVIEDNGVGRKRAAELQSDRKGYISRGTSLTQRRLDLLNKNRQHALEVEIEDLYDEKGQAEGTRVLLSIPIH